MPTEKNRPQNPGSKDRLNRNEQSSSSSSRRESDLGTNRSSNSSNQRQQSGNMDRKNTSRK